MNGLCTGFHGSGDHLVDDEVAFPRRRRPEPYRGVRLMYVPGVGIGITVDCHGSNSHAPQRAHDAYRDLTTIGDEDGVEIASHFTHILKTP